MLELRFGWIFDSCLDFGVGIRRKLVLFVWVLLFWVVWF